MDELELFKQQWQRQDSELPSYKKQDIYKMLHKKSSSIVKWIFLISLIEFAFWVVIELVGMYQGVDENISALNLGTFYRVTLIINYVVIVGFIIKFFINYRQIQTTDTVRALMRNIIKTRRTVKAYVWFNIIFFAFTFIISIVVTLNSLEGLNEQQFWLSLGVVALILAVVLALIWVFYRLLYGILTRKLLTNYKNLKQIEV